MDDVQQASLVRRMWNWGAWARSGSSAAGHCGSAERFYVPPRDDDNTRAESLAREPILVVDAERVERAVAAVKRRAPRFGKLMVMEYVEQRPEIEKAKALNVSPRMVQPSLITGLRMVMAALDRLATD